MLDWIPMYIIDVTGTVAVVPDPMLPETALPNPARSSRHKPAPAREARLDHLPSGGVIRVLVWKCPESVEVVRQDDHGVDFEGSLGADASEDLPEKIHLL